MDLGSDGRASEASEKSYKRQATSLTRLKYNDILQYKGERLCKQKKL